jgi:hypothetical protein
VKKEKTEWGWMGLNYIKRREHEPTQIVYLHTLIVFSPTSTNRAILEGGVGYLTTWQGNILTWTGPMGGQEGSWSRSMVHIAPCGCVGLPSSQVGEWTLNL